MSKPGSSNVGEVEAMMLRIMLVLTELFYCRIKSWAKLVPSMKLTKGGGGTELNVTMMLSVLNSVWRCSLNLHMRMYM